MIYLEKLIKMHLNRRHRRTRMKNRWRQSVTRTTHGDSSRLTRIRGTATSFT